jgi:6-pyruvoyl-tetrahydropterin synthase
MAFIRITKEFKFEMAHALMGYDGPCKHIHGHSYELWVTIIGVPDADENSPKNGMVMDFGLLKNIVRKNIIEQFDHALVINKQTPDTTFASVHELFDKLMLVDYQPTSENMLIDFARRIKDKLPEEVKLHSLKLRETVTSVAEWYADDNE